MCTVDLISIELFLVHKLQSSLYPTRTMSCLFCLTIWHLLINVNLLKDASQNPHLSVYAQGIHYHFAFRLPHSPEGISLESSMFW